MTKPQAFELSPVDTLFFRDARPMQAGAGSGGHGANWPMPNVIHEALRTALLRLDSWLPAEKGITHHKTGVSRPRERTVASDLFRSLRTVGPFPLCDGCLYLPTPSDLVLADDAISLLSPMLDPKGRTNLPCAWIKPVVSKVRPTKEELPSWVNLDYFKQYLKAPDSLPKPEQISLYVTEHRIGIGIDCETGTTEEGKLFASEHLRMVNDSRLWFKASLSQHDSKQNPCRISDLADDSLTVGGESRFCRLSEGRADLLSPMANTIPAGRRIKWVTVTPAVFCGGWRPNWIEPEEGRVMLRDGDTRRLENENRESWRRRIRSFPPTTAKLVAACIPKPIHFSGWDVVSGGPKPTMLAVPAGAVYYFEANSNRDAETLVQALHGRTRSDFFGEKGMGLGFCGMWKPLDA